MLPRKAFFGNLFLVDYHNRCGELNGGCFVECGTWRGGMAFAITAILPNIRDCHFFDSFEGLPTAGKFDGRKAHQEQQDGALWHNNNSAELDDFLSGLEPINSSHRPLYAHKGWFEDTLPQFRTERSISILRLDGDWYDSTLCIFENLYEKVIPGGLILIDDYYDWDGCTRAVHDFLSKRKLRDRLRQSRFGGVAYIVKEMPES